MPIETTMTIEVPAWKCSYCDKKFLRDGCVSLRDCLWHERKHPESQQLHELVGRYAEYVDDDVTRLTRINKVIKKGDMLISGSDTCPGYDYAEFDGYDVRYVYNSPSEGVSIGALAKIDEVTLLENFGEDDVATWWEAKL